MSAAGILDGLVVLLLALGSFFLMVSTVGILRLPDFFTRAHAVGKSETLGSLLLLLGLAIHNGFALDSAKLALILVLVAVTNPTGIHTLTRAALNAGVGIWVLEKDRRKGPAGVAGRRGRDDDPEVDG